MVDDDSYNLMIVGNFLKNWGFDYDTAENGKIAIENLVNQKYDLLLLDLQMPILNGLDVIAFLKKQQSENKCIPIILCTTLKLDHVYLESLKENLVEGYLVKPFDEHMLKSCIQDINQKFFINK